MGKKKIVKQGHVGASPRFDFDAFIQRIEKNADPSRLGKTLKMLQKDSFQLFKEPSAVEVFGVVKSQTDAKLVYACRLTVGGWFSCCTQKLNPCGGMRGQICKHILMLVIGLAKSGQLDADDVDDWIYESKLRQPDLNKERMSDILMKYKGAESGEIDWRPTETLPEDFYAL